jgi:predicted transcriptional regulator
MEPAIFPAHTNFSNAQLELLNAFSHNLSEDDLWELKKAIAKFFGERAIKAANEVWDEKGWTDEDVARMLTTKMRSGRG